MVVKTAPTVCYKAGNIATAANFARRLLETNPTNESQAKKARQVLQAAERNMTDKSQLNYDFRNPFVICGATHVPIYRGQKDVSCPYYCSSRFVATQEGQFCTVCDLAVVGADASGLLCSPSQVDVEECSPFLRNRVLKQSIALRSQFLKHSIHVRSRPCPLHRRISTQGLGIWGG
ncbi:hypothetical protein DVH24_023598 [Malus domestica]|uniref:Coatomer alpha subunit C-terminal domain-containing protein n=1 Tax=Malus domestica TaxID=3750 RepID=A0A498I557_MALDO|nr:hypothetical protein DVH24_023598 [Malus domestica]